MLQLAKNHFQVNALFESVSRILYTVGASCKRKDALRTAQHQNIPGTLENGWLFSGRGLNQETILQCSGDIYWGSHYTTLLSLRYMHSVLEVLKIVMEDDMDNPQSVETSVLLNIL